MPRGTVMPSHTPRPFLELRVGGLHMTVQCVPRWLVTTLTTVAGSAFAAWFTSR